MAHVNDEKQVRILIDQGSTLSFCSKKLVNDLNLPLYGKTKMVINTVLGPKEIEYDTPNLRLYFTDGSFAFTLFLYVVDAQNLGSVPSLQLPNKKVIDEALRKMGKPISS